MASLGEAVIQGAQQQAQQVGHTVGDAMQAYHIAATAEHARQELDMEKQKQTLAKATWVAQMYDKIGRTSGPAQQVMLDSFGKQMQTIEPGFNPDTLSVLKKDPETLRAISATASRALSRGTLDPKAADALLAMHNGDLDGFMQSATKMGEQQAQIEASRLKAESFNLRGQTMQDNAIQTAGDKFDKDPNLGKLLPMGQSLGRDLSTLAHNSKEHPVTYQTLHESLMNVASVLGAGSLSDSRVNSITPHVSDEMRSKIEQFVASNPNVQADPKYVDYVRSLVMRLHGAVRADVADRADQLAAGRDPSLYHTPGIGEAIKQKHDYYKSGQWMGQQQAAAQTVRMKDPQGNIREVPANQVEAAKAAGGTLAGE